MLFFSSSFGHLIRQACADASAQKKKTERDLIPKKHGTEAVKFDSMHGKKVLDHRRTLNRINGIRHTMPQR